MTLSTVALPDPLIEQISVMRRNPAEFTFLAIARCKLCYKKNAVEIGHPLNPNGAGTWCPFHGFLAFDSVKIRPIGEEYTPKHNKRVKVL